MRNAFFVLCLASLTACEWEPTGVVDSGTDSGAPLDAGATSDAGVKDSGVALDGGFDAGLSDAGPIDAGFLDASVVDAGPIDAGPFDAGNGPPIVAALNQWTWVPFPDSTCGNGSPAGLAVNMGDAGFDLLVYMAPGGLCWDYPSCFQSFLPPSHITDTFEADGGTPLREAEGLAAAGLFDRTNPTNVFRNANYVYVPYCTADLHRGRSVQTFTGVDGGSVEVWHHGAYNVDAFLRRLRPTFPLVTRLWLMGSSAGGYGALFNMPSFVESFPFAKVHLFADGAPPVQPAGARFDVWTQAWNLPPTPGCFSCGTSLPSHLDFVATKFPNSRIGLAAYQSDLIISYFWDYAPPALPVGALATQHFDTHANSKYFLLPGLLHYFVNAPSYNDRLPDGGVNTGIPLSVDSSVSAREWIRRWAVGDPAWASTR